MESVFDRIIDRRSTDSLKWAKYRHQDILPMWVADMDFRSPEVVIEALRERIEHGVMGYSIRPENLNSVVAAWIEAHHNWHIEETWIVWLPGLVCGMNAACRGLAESHQSVAAFTPIYPPFLTSPEHSQRHLIRCPLSYQDGGYRIDFDYFEANIDERTALLLLCSPHNPVGRVWTRQELETLTDICIRKNIIICSDEIHCDLVLDEGKKHIPTASLSERAKQHTVTLMAASKTFNIPGLNCAFAIIPNPHLRKRFRQATFGIVPYVSILGYAGTVAAYQNGQSWRQSLIAYLRGNRDFLCEAVNAIPGLRMDWPEATYLGWIDARELPTREPAAFFEQAGVGLSDGKDFDGAGFVRLNFGCPKAVLEQAVARMRKGVCGS